MHCPSSPKGVAKLLVRVAFGVSLALIGLNHYMTLDAFVGMTASGLGPLTGLGTLWAYILPALEIVGGVLLAAKYRADIGAWAAGVALASIVIGLLLKTVVGGVALTDVMPTVNTTFIWIITYFFVAKSCVCCGSCKEGGMAGASGDHGGHGHSCATC